MKYIGRLLFKLIGWKIVGSFPENKQFILLVAPHTSNWDFIVGLLGRFALGVKVHFLAKKELFFFPLGFLLKVWGGYPVDRQHKSNKVEQVVQLFQENENLKLAITPEGTRGPVTRWKEGFYYIAYQAKIPIVMVGFDYSRKELQIQPAFWPTGDIDKDFLHFIAYAKTVKGRYPKVIPGYQSKGE